MQERKSSGGPGTETAALSKQPMPENVVDMTQSKDPSCFKTNSFPQRRTAAAINLTENIRKCLTWALRDSKRHGNDKKHPTLMPSYTDPQHSWGSGDTLGGRQQLQKVEAWLKLAVSWQVAPVAQLFDASFLHRYLPGTPKKSERLAVESNPALRQCCPEFQPQP